MILKNFNRSRKERSKLLKTISTISFLLINAMIFPLNLTNYPDQAISHNSRELNKAVVFQLYTNNVIGNDNRIRITPTTSYPWSTFVKMYITWGAYNTYGTGVLVDKNHVLTAGHCVYSNSRGGWADTIKVVPGADNGFEPYGYAWGINARSYSRWINGEDGEHDFALITLDRDIGLQTGWMELYTSIPSNPVYSGILNTAGYPYDLDSGNNMYWTSETGGYTNEYNHFFYLDIEGGQSGSPVWIYDGVNRYILSIVTSSWIGLDVNYGTRINRNKLDCIINWITADDTSTDKPDLRSESNSFAGFNPALGGAGLTNLDIWCRVINVGTIMSSPFTVSYYASPDKSFSTSDYLIGTDTIVSLAATESTISQWSGLIPENIPSGDYYIGWILDVENNIDEFKEDNNWNYIWDYKLQVDADPPTNPDTCEQFIGTTLSDVWQNSVNPPSFSWNSATDGATGIAGYYYYWGTNPDGVAHDFTTESNFEPSPVNTGIYYLRVKAKDNMGNNATWKTLYVFKYDGTAPLNPSSCDQRAGSTESDVWQGDIDDPFFTWDDGWDNHTGVAGYYYYWGKNPDGTSNSFTMGNIFDPPPVTPGFYYFRIRTKDNAGNYASWTTLYIFKYTGHSGNNNDGSRPIEGSDILITSFLYGLWIIIGFLSVILIYQVRIRLKR